MSYLAHQRRARRNRSLKSIAIQCVLLMLSLYGIAFLVDVGVEYFDAKLTAVHLLTYILGWLICLCGVLFSLLTIASICDRWGR